VRFSDFLSAKLRTISVIITKRKKLAVTFFPFLCFVLKWRTRQTLWGECTDANPKTVAKRYMIEKKLVPLQYES